MEILLEALKTGFIDSKTNSIELYQPQLVLNSSKNKTKVAQYLIDELKEAKFFQFSIAFITLSGIATLKQTFLDLAIKGVKGQILTSTYLMFNNPKVFRELLKFSNIEVRIVDDSNFHAKGYLFHKEDYHSIIIGSANLTQQALAKNNEWNLLVNSLHQGSLVHQVENTFNELWQNALILDETWITNYEVIFTKYNNRNSYTEVYDEQAILKPNEMQKKALQSLALLRSENAKKALLISATGTGKTLLAAFDVMVYNPKRLLFVVHREQILDKAIDAFKKVMPDKVIKKYLGQQKDIDADYIFASIQTLSKAENLQHIPKDYFNYIIIDETHRVGASSYLRVIEYFITDFLLGMSATPERSDDFNIYELFDYNIAYEIRLQDALAQEMLAPFHYYGISDFSVDGKTIDDYSTINNLVSDERVDYIVEKAEFYGYDGDRLRGIIFVRNQEEAKELELKLNQRNYHTKALIASDSKEAREKAIKSLEAEYGLNYIITVDLFNEGVDIPSINQIIMLRPTQSSIVFIQQLGRGLRKHESKEYVVVIDFIANYQNNFLIPIALFGDKSFNKDNLKRYVTSPLPLIEGVSSINFDRIAKEKIYEAINKVNFSSRANLKQKYFDLKQQLNRRVLLRDFIIFNGLDPLLYNKSFNSYFSFLASIDEIAALNEVESNLLKYISWEFLKGTRKEEAIILKMLLDNGAIEWSNQSASMNSALRVLDGSHLTNKTKRRYQDYVLVKHEANKVVFSSDVNSALKNELFKSYLNECLDYILLRNKTEYQPVYQDTNLVLYQKYEKSDITKLLNWKQDIVPLNIGGYFIDDYSNSMAVFINYQTLDEISNTIRYEHKLINSSELISYSKNNRNLSSEDVKKIINDNLAIHLFIRKNQESDGCSYLYLGLIKPHNEFKEVEVLNVSNKTSKIVEFSFKLAQPIRHDIYEYLISKTI